MQLNGKQIAQICDILVEAFSKDTLRQLVRIELDKRLEAIADGENFSVVTFNLVTWAEQQDRIDDLIRGAYKWNPGNQQLQQLHFDSRMWPTARVAGGSPVAGRVPTDADLAATQPGPASIDIFLSYSRQDGAAMRSVQDALRAAGLSVWTDENLQPGTPSWSAAIEEAIRQATTFVVLLSPAAKTSAWVNNEPLPG